MTFIPNFSEKISQIVKNSHEFPFIRTGFVHAFGVILAVSCSISQYILVNRDGILAYSCDSNRLQMIPQNSRNTIVSVSLQYSKTSRMDTKFTKFHES